MVLQLPRFSHAGPDADLSGIAGYEQISTQQRLFLYAALYGRLNILLTGSAGVGKSFCLDHLYRLGKRLGLRIAFTSTTGVSATQLPNGCTLHSFLQMGLAEGDPREVARKAAQKKEVRARIMETQILVIDEISMASARLLDLLDLLGKAVHKNDRLPYGGKLQVILVGDFAQLPPIKKRQEHYAERKEGNGVTCDNDDDGFAYLQRFEKLDYCFQHPDFDQLVDCTLSLEQVFRQSDVEFVGLLNRIRFARHTKEDLDLLYKASNQRTLGCDEPFEEAQDNVHMFAINRKVDDRNDTEMKSLLLSKGKDIKRETFCCKTKMHKANLFNQAMFHSWIEEQKKNCLAKPVIHLAIGAKVMLVINLDVSSNLANGSMGKVVDFHKMSRNPIVRFHESGHHFHDVEIAPHQYKYEDPGAISSMLEEEEGEDEKCNAASNKKRKRGGNSSELIPHVIYEQIPLKLAWALSIHKSQGSTLRNLTIDAGNIFENGQFYVALSRAKSIQGVTLTNFHASCIRANPLVIQFYDKLRIQNTNWIEKLKEGNASESSAMTNLVRDMCKEKQKRLADGQSTIEDSMFFRKPPPLN